MRRENKTPGPKNPSREVQPSDMFVRAPQLKRIPLVRLFNVTPAAPFTNHLDRTRNHPHHHWLAAVRALLHQLRAWPASTQVPARNRSMRLDSRETHDTRGLSNPTSKGQVELTLMGQVTRHKWRSPLAPHPHAGCVARLDVIARRPRASR